MKDVLIGILFGVILVLLKIVTIPLFLIFLTLKLTAVISWSWWIVFLPLFGFVVWLIVATFTTIEK